MDREGKEYERPEFIDLDALARYVDKLVSIIDGYLTYLDEEQQSRQEYEEEMR